MELISSFTAFNSKKCAMGLLSGYVFNIKSVLRVEHKKQLLCNEGFSVHRK